MQELAFYRKYRPAKWDDVLGQNHVVGVLEKSVRDSTVSHAYLFVGSRGTGKTSVARIFAREIGVTANDLYEIDAASNRGIEDIKELREGVRALPLESKYKVYIIDEVHMLSKDAWGALLKTLEEPPKHVIFILATTEFHKVPETITSRCQVFTFRKPATSILRGLVEDIAKREGYELDGGSAELIALLGDGSFRDAEGTLERVLNFAGKKSKKISRSAVEEITGAPKTALVNDFLSALSGKDLEKGMGVVKKAGKENLDMKLYLKLIIERLRFALMLKYAPKMETEIKNDLSEDDLKFLKSLPAGSLNSKTLVALLDAYQNLDRAFIPELPLELALVKLLGDLESNQD
ncbi:MAG: DNA polymerase III subunit gamma/tau [Patescibacteria group bacterium]